MCSRIWAGHRSSMTVWSRSSRPEAALRGNAMSTKQAALAGFLGVSLVFVALDARRAAADESDPPTRAARMAYTAGSVSLQPAGTQDWIATPLNRPLTTGDQLWSDQNGRAELELDGSVLRVS